MCESILKLKGCLSIHTQYVPFSSYYNKIPHLRPHCDYLLLELTAAARAMPMPLQMMAYQQPRDRKHTVMATAKMMAGRAYSELPVRYTVCI